MDQQRSESQAWGTPGMLSGYRITRYDERRVLIVNEHAERFTKTEYTLLVCLLEETMVSTERLLSLFGADASDRTMEKALEKHISHLREKLRTLDLCLHRVYQYGYLLLACPGHSAR